MDYNIDIIKFYVSVGDKNKCNHEGFSVGNVYVYDIEKC